MNDVEKVKDTVRKLVGRMNDGTVTAYHVHIETGVHQNTLSNLKKGTLKVEDMKFSTVEELYNYYSE